MKPVKIAMIGAGHDHAVECRKTLNDNRDYFEVVDITRPTDEYMWKFEGEHSMKPFEGVKFTDIEELINMPDLEAVAIEAGKEHGLSTRRCSPSAELRCFAKTVRGEVPMYRTYEYEKTLLKYVIMALRCR